MALVCCFLCCLVPGAIILGAAHLTVKGLEPVDATVVDTMDCGFKASDRADGVWRQQYRIIFSYVLPSNGTVINATTDTCAGSPPPIGSVESIWYDPDDPKDILQDARFEGYQAAGIGLISFALVCILVLVAVSCRRSKQFAGTAPGSDPILLQVTQVQATPDIGYASAGIVASA